MTARVGGFRWVAARWAGLFGVPPTPPQSALVIRGLGTSPRLVTRGLGSAMVTAGSPDPRRSTWSSTGPDPFKSTWSSTGPDPFKSTWSSVEN